MPSIRGRAPNHRRVRARRARSPQPADDGFRRPVLAVDGLSVTYRRRGGVSGRPESAKAVDDVSFEVLAGRTLGIVGESGGMDISAMSQPALRVLRPKLQLVPQNSAGAFDPAQTSPAAR